MKQNNIMVTLLLSLLLTGCIHIDEEASQNFNNSVELFGEAIAGEINKQHQLAFLTSWHFKKTGKWPQSQQDLEKLVTENQVPIDLSYYSNITFQENDTSITIEYMHNKLSLPIKLTSSKEELINYKPPSFEEKSEGIINIPKSRTKRRTGTLIDP